MITIQTGMLVALGCFIASLVWLLLASAFWSRAVRLTTERLKRSMPISESEIKADRDRLRAEHAIKVHSLEKRLDQARLERARHLIDINRRDARISAIETEIAAIRVNLEENQNARRVLEQTIADRLPKVEARLAEAKRLLFNRDREIAELTQSAKRHKLALEEVSSVNAQKNAEIERLNSALGGRGRNRNGSDRREGDAPLQAEVVTLSAKTREQAALIDRLQRRLSQGYVVPGPSSAPAASDNDHADLLEETLSEAEAALRGALEQPEPAVAGALAKGKEEITRLQARIEDQAGEIARLRAGLAALEQTTPTAGLKNSKLALKARIGSAEAQAERQAATISRLRAELASANERLARQAAHFMDEMRRLGGAAPANGAGATRRPARNGEARKLVDRVAQLRPALAEKPRALTAAPPAQEASNGAPNGNEKSSAATPTPAPQAARTPEPALAVSAASAASAPAAAEMPQTAAIPEERRKPRLLDRITSLAKS